MSYMINSYSDELNRLVLQRTFPSEMYQVKFYQNNYSMLYTMRALNKEIYFYKLKVYLVHSVNVVIPLHNVQFRLARLACLPFTIQS